MIPPEIIAYVVSASLAALIGLERQWEDQQKQPDRQTGVGMRTFILWALLGTTSAYVADLSIPSFYLLGFAGFLVLLVLQVFARRKERPSLGETTLSVAVLTFLIGSLVYWEQFRIALILSVSIIILLEGKKRLHAMSGKLSRRDIFAALQFLAVTGIILPLAPNEDYGPFGAFNPFKIWLMVVLVTGLGFAGYLILRFVGTGRGIPVVGVLGGMVSSTVTSFAFSRQSRVTPQVAKALAVAVILACTVMFIRVAILVAAVGAPLLVTLLPALIAMALPGLVYGGWYLLKKGEGEAEVDLPEIRNPLNLRVAILFAALYALVIFLARAGQHYAGDAGLTLVSFLSGLTDMDAITLSLSQMANAGEITRPAASAGIIMGAISNTLFKGIFALAVGATALRKTIWPIFLLTILIGAAAWWALKFV